MCPQLVREPQTLALNANVRTGIDAVLNRKQLGSADHSFSTTTYFVCFLLPYTLSNKTDFGTCRLHDRHTYFEKLFFTMHLKQCLLKSVTFGLANDAVPLVSECSPCPCPLRVTVFNSTNFLMHRKKGDFHRHSRP